MTTRWITCVDEATVTAGMTVSTVTADDHRGVGVDDVVAFVITTRTMELSEKPALIFDLMYVLFNC